MSLLLLITSFLVNSTYAEDINLVKVTNEEDTAISYIYVSIDEDKNIDGFGKTTYENDVLMQRTSFPGELDYTGVILYQFKSMAIVKVKALNFEGKNGGAIEIDYLYNGLVNSRKQLAVTVERTSDSWQMIKDGKIINHLHLISHKVPFAGLVGIKEVEIK